MESRIVRSILQWSQREGFLAYKLHGSVFSQRGLPDVLVIIPASPWPLTLFLECKEPYQYAKPLQRKRLADLNRMGVPAVVVHSLAEVQVLIQQLRMRIAQP